MEVKKAKEPPHAVYEKARLEAPYLAADARRVRIGVEEHLGTSQQAVQLPLIDAEEEKAVRLVADIDQLEQVYKGNQFVLKC